MKYKTTIPKPEFMTGTTPGFYGCYAWRIDCNGLYVLGDTRREAVHNYREAMQREYGVDV